MNVMKCQTQVIKINDWLIIRLPNEISKTLPSRGMAMADIKIDHKSYTLPLEPDGRGSHWFKTLPEMNLSENQLVSFMITSTDNWIEPNMPEDLSSALNEHDLNHRWASLTIKARWAWIRWIGFTKNPDTRQNRIQTACSMLNEGKKRPCCFDHSRSTEIHVSKNGQLDMV